MHPAAWTLSSLDDKAEATVLSSRRRWTIAGSGRQSRVTAAVPSRRPKNSRARERPESLALAGRCISPFTLGGMRLIAAILCVAVCASCTSNRDAGAGDHGSARPDRDVACHLPAGFDDTGGHLDLGAAVTETAIGHR